MDDFLNPLSKYYGDFTPEKLVFNANLQEFATKIDYIVALETNGKLDTEDAFNKVKNLCNQLEISNKQLLDQED